MGGAAKGLVAATSYEKEEIRGVAAFRGQGSSPTVRPPAIMGWNRKIRLIAVLPQLGRPCFPFFNGFIPFSMALFRQQGYVVQENYFLVMDKDFSSLRDFILRI